MQPVPSIEYRPDHALEEAGVERDVVHPLEWDLAHVGAEAAEVFPEADADLVVTMRKLVGAEVAIWCWHTYGRAPAVNEAANHHLEALRG